MPIVLPTEKHKAETGWPDQATWLVFGNQKVGKTKFASGWPECLILNMEHRGTRYIEGAYCQDIKSLEELRGAFGQLKADSDKGKLLYKTVSLDTVDVIKGWIDSEVVHDLGITEMGEANRGSDWRAATDRTVALIKTFAQLPINIHILAHAQPVKLGEKTIGATVSLPGRLASRVLGTVENILFCTKKGNVIQIIPQVCTGIDSGSRNPIIEKIASCGMSYAALRAAYDKQSKKETKNANGK